MIKLPDFSKSVQFQRLRERMGIKEIPVLRPVVFERKVIRKRNFIVANTEGIRLEKELQNKLVPADSRDISVSEKGLLTYKGRKVAAYIRDQRRGVNYYTKHSGYRYHLCDCSTLQTMRNAGREKRYFVTKRSDGQFKVHDVAWGNPREFLAKLELCQNCIRELSRMDLYFNPFSLKEFFKRYDSDVPETITKTETEEEIQTYTPDQEDYSREYRKAANYCCQSCRVDCSSEPSLLHLHHCDGVPSNNEHTNLRILCVDCHSKQPMHDQIRHPQKAKDQINRIKVLRKEQDIPD